MVYFNKMFLMEKVNIKSSTDNKGTFLENDDLYSKTKKKPKKDLQIVA